MSKSQASQGKAAPVGPLRAVIWILLCPVLLVVLFVAVVLLYLALSRFPYDNPDALILAPAPSVSERFEFHADSATVDVSLDKADLWWVVKNTDVVTGNEDFMRLLDGARMSVDQAMLSITPEGLAVAANVKAFRLLTLPVQATLAVEKSGAALEFRLAGLSLGKSLEIPLDKAEELTGLALTDLSVRVDDTDVPLLQKLAGIRFLDGRIDCTFTLDGAVFLEARDRYADLREAQYHYAELLPLTTLLTEAHEAGDPDFMGDAYRAALRSFEADAANYEAFRVEVLAFAPEHIADDYLAGSEGQYLPRFLPGITKAAADARRAAVQERVKGNSTFLENTVRALRTDYAAGKLYVARTRFARPDGSAVDVWRYTGAALPMENWPADDTTRIVLLKGAAARTDDLMKFSDVPTTPDGALGGVDNTARYAIGVTVVMPDGTRELLYINDKNAFASRELDEESLNALLQARFLPVSSLD